MKVLFLLLFLCSCTTLTEEEKEERAESLAEARDAYYILAARCKASGGYMIVTNSIDGIKRWNKWDYDSARCAYRKIY